MIPTTCLLCNGKLAIYSGSRHCPSCTRDDKWLGRSKFTIYLQVSENAEMAEYYIDLPNGHSFNSAKHHKMSHITLIDSRIVFEDYVEYEDDVQYFIDKCNALLLLS